MSEQLTPERLEQLLAGTAPSDPAEEEAVKLFAELRGTSPAAPPALRQTPLRRAVRPQAAMPRPDPRYRSEARAAPAMPVGSTAPPGAAA